MRSESIRLFSSFGNYMFLNINSMSTCSLSAGYTIGFGVKNL